MKKNLLLLITGILLSSFNSKNSSGTTDYLNLAGPIKFNGSEFRLAWSANPNANYFKQEYIPPGESVEKYNQMVLVEVIFGELTVQEAVNAQIKLIENRKNTDAVARYEVIENPGTEEIILDFLMSAGSKTALSIVEWNAYRYKSFQDKSGRKGILLFAISKRGYNNDITNFLTSLKTNRVNFINALGAFSLPEITVKK